MGTAWIVALTIVWLTCPANGKVTCREVQLARDCEALCKQNRHGTVSCELRVAVLLPADSSFDIALLKVRPVLGKFLSRSLRSPSDLPTRPARRSFFRPGRLRSQIAGPSTLLAEAEVPSAGRPLRRDVRPNRRDRQLLELRSSVSRASLRLLRG